MAISQPYTDPQHTDGAIVGVRHAPQFSREHHLAYTGDHIVEPYVDSNILDTLEPMPCPDSDCCKEAAIKMMNWLIDTVASSERNDLMPEARTVAVKCLALRYILHRESRSMDEAAAGLGLGRAALSKYVTKFSDALGLPAYRKQEARDTYARRQRNVWSTSRAHQRVKPYKTPPPLPP